MALTLAQQLEKVREIEYLELRTSLIDTINIAIGKYGEDSYIQSMSTPDVVFNHEVREFIEEIKTIDIDYDFPYKVSDRFNELIAKRQLALDKLKEKKKEKPIKAKSYNLDDEG